MAGSNFQQWNPTSSNQENDAQYTADSLRSGGAQTDNICPSPTFNKFAYQTSTFVAALAQALANKGYTVSDASLATLTSVLANVLTLVDLPGLLLTLAYAPTFSFDSSKWAGFYMPLTGNVSSFSVANAQNGTVVTAVFQQDATGGRTVAWPANFKGTGIPSSAPGDLSAQTFELMPDGYFHPKTPMTVS